MVTQLSFYHQRGKAAGEVANAGKHKLFERESKTKYILSATLAMTLDFLADYNYQSDKRIAIKQEMKRPCSGDSRNPGVDRFLSTLGRLLTTLDEFLTIHILRGSGS